MQKCGLVVGWLWVGYRWLFAILHYFTNLNGICVLGFSIFEYFFVKNGIKILKIGIWSIKNLGKPKNEFWGKGGLNAAPDGILRCEHRRGYETIKQSEPRQLPQL